VQYSLSPKADKWAEKATILYDVLKSHSRLDSKLQAARELEELRGADDQDLFVENDQDFHFDALLNTEFSDEPLHWSDNTDVLASMEYVPDLSEYATDKDVDSDDANTDELIRALLQVKLSDEQDGGAETDFDVAYADSALIAAQVNTEDDFTTAYTDYYASSKYGHNGAVLDSDSFDISSYEYDAVSDDDGDDAAFSITQISTYQSNDDNEIDVIEETEEKVVTLMFTIQMRMMLFCWSINS